MNGQTHSPKPERHSPLLMFPAHWYRPLQRLDTRATLCRDDIFLTTPSPVRFLQFPRNSLLLSSYLCRIKRKENSSCSACGHPLQDLTHLLLDCPASKPLRRAILGTTFSIIDLRSRPWGISVEFLHAPIPRKESGCTITTINRHMV